MAMTLGIRNYRISGFMAWRKDELDTPDPIGKLLVSIGESARKFSLDALKEAVCGEEGDRDSWAEFGKPCGEVEERACVSCGARKISHGT